MSKSMKTITVASGKGGVGKTNVVANLAIALSQLGERVLIFDADMGLSNIDVLLNLSPKYNVEHVLNGEKRLRDILVDGPHGVRILPASSGVQDITDLDEFQRMMLIEQFDELDGEVDVLLVDSAAGISKNVAFFCVASQDIVVVTSPEPTALTDAYALIKVLSTSYQQNSFKVLVNSARDAKEGVEIFKKLYSVADKFLNIGLDYLGYIPFDESVRKSVRAQRAIVDQFPNSPASVQLRALAQKIHQDDSEVKVKGGIQFFISHLVKGRA